MIGATRFELLQAVDALGEGDCNAIALRTGYSVRHVRSLVRELVNMGYLNERKTACAGGRGAPNRILVSRSELRLPREIDPAEKAMPRITAGDCYWWPMADAVVQQAIHRMVSAGRVAA